MTEPARDPKAKAEVDDIFKARGLDETAIERAIERRPVLRAVPDREEPPNHSNHPIEQ